MKPPKEIPEIIKFLRELTGGFSLLLIAGSILSFVSYIILYISNNASPRDNVDFLWFYERLTLSYSAVLGIRVSDNCSVHWVFLLLSRSEILTDHKIIWQHGTPSECSYFIYCVEADYNDC